MSTLPRSFAHFRWLAAGLLCLALQACRTFSTEHATVETPFVVSFEFQEPVQASPAEKERFRKALVHAVPAKSRILVDGTEVWPLLKTERVSAAGAAGGREASTVNTKGPGGANPARPGFIRSGHYTAQNRMDVAFVARAKSTQYVAFKSEKDMREFLRILGGGRR